MAFCFGSFGIGYVIMFWGLTMSTDLGDPSDDSSGPATPAILIGILLMAIGVVGSAVVQSRKRQAERRRERAERWAEELVRR